MKNLHWFASSILAATLLASGCDRSPATKPPTAKAPEMSRTLLPTPNDSSQVEAPQAAADESAKGGALPQPAPFVQTVEAKPGESPPIIVWDVSTDRNPTKIGWPKDTGNNKVFSMEGDFQFQLKVQDHEDFSGRVRQVESRRDGGLIEGVEITSLPQSTDDAYTHAREMLTQMHFAPADVAKLEAWLQKANVGNYDNLEFHHTNSYNRTFTIRLVNDGTSEQPWSVDLDVDWSQVCGCHG